MQYGMPSYPGIDDVMLDFSWNCHSYYPSLLRVTPSFVFLQVVARDRAELRGGHPPARRQQKRRPGPQSGPHGGRAPIRRPDGHPGTMTDAQFIPFVCGVPASVLLYTVGRPVIR